MIEKTKKIYDRYQELGNLISLPETLTDMNKWKKLVKEHSALEEIAAAHVKLTEYLNESEKIKEMTECETDSEMKELLNEEFYNLKEKISALEEKIKVLLLPKDENDDNNVIVEIRAGAGGDEAALFAGRLANMYACFAARRGWQVEYLDVNETELGGMKEISFMIIGEGAYADLKFESGVHRVQRVPVTESSGRIHTSTATVAILPEMEEVDFQINEKDLRVDTYRSSGAGGQHVNKTESAIRLTHLPTGIVVACQDERSQIKNREKAMKHLQSKLYDFYNTQKENEYRANRKNQIGTGDRSERIRTYNFPQDRITDHRIGMSVHSLENFLNGDMDEMLTELKIADQKAKLESGI